MAHHTDFPFSRSLIALAVAGLLPLAAQAENADPVQLKEVRVGSGAAERSYQETEATGATKIAAPLRDIPQSVQVVPRQLIDDQSAVRPSDVLKNVSGVVQGNAAFGDTFIFRGFATDEFLRDGYPDRRYSIRDTANIENIEVLKGPASVLYGRVEPGGTLNYVTKRPLFVDRYSVELKADSDGLVRPSMDLSTVSADGKLGLRVNAASENGSNFRDYSYSNRKFVAAALTWRLTPDTQLAFELESLRDRRLFDRGVPPLGLVPAPIPVTRLIAEPTDRRVVEEGLVGYTLEHRLNTQWQIKHALRAFSATDDDVRTRFLQPSATASTTYLATGTISRDYLQINRGAQGATAQLELIGDTQLAGMRHQLLLGLERDQHQTYQQTTAGATIRASNAINIYNPVYGNFVPAGVRQTAQTEVESSATALYAQDLVALAPQWKLLVGARLDKARSHTDNLLTRTTTGSSDNAVSPRAGVVWQPSEQLSLYTSYSSSFIPVTGQDFAGNLFEPTKGKQLEVGLKSDWLDQRLTATVAAYRIKKQNVSTTDPVNTGFNVQTGEITSDGVELDVVGSPVTGLNLVGNLSVNDARVSRTTVANTLGRRSANVPDKMAGLWASYELQNAAWRGWGGGAGVNYVAERPGLDTATSFYLPSYTRWDASLWYRAAHWQVALKVNNLFDKVHYVSATAQGIAPGTPRNFMLSTRYQF